MTLAELQAIFQRAVVAGDDDLLPLIRDSSRTGRETLLGVYRHAYAARLVEIVRNDHPALASYLGDEAFDGMARLYVAAHPSTTPNARWFSRHLPRFVATTEPYSAHAELAELAAIEKALNDAFDSPSDDVLTLEALATVPPEAWPSLGFTPHASARRLDLTTNALAIWMALQADATPPSAQGLPDVERLLIWREEMTPKVRALGEEETMPWGEAAQGVAFGVLCELAATYDDAEHAPLRVAQYLQTWLAAGLLTTATRGGWSADRCVAEPETSWLRETGDHQRA